MIPTHDRSNRFEKKSVVPAPIASFRLEKSRMPSLTLNNRDSIP